MHKRTMLCGYGGSLGPEPDEFDTLQNFDDRTLATLIGKPAVLGDGVDNDNPYRALPLERWRDRA